MILRELFLLLQSHLMKLLPIAEREGKWNPEIFWPKMCSKLEINSHLQNQRAIGKGRKRNGTRRRSNNLICGGRRIKVLPQIFLFAKRSGKQGCFVHNYRYIYLATNSLALEL